MTCTFIGHRDAPEIIRDKLKSTLIVLIREAAVENFYIGNNGGFDRIALAVLRELKLAYPHIKYSVVLACLPTENSMEIENSIYPEGLETVPKRFAIDRRNRWMLKRSDYLVSYVVHSTGGACKFSRIAKKMGVTVINLAER